MSTRDLKKMAYIIQTLLGIVCLVIADLLWTNQHFYSVTNRIAAIVLLISGLASVMFGVLTYCLRDDPDIWR